MRAICVREYGGPEVLRLDEVADPVAGPGEVLVRLRAAGVNPVDTYVRTGTYERRPPLPYIPGGDGAGDVVAVGPGVQRLRVGQRVFVATHEDTYAERIALPETLAWPLPDAVSYEQGAAVGIPYGTAYRAIHQRAAAQPGEWLLVHGGSGAVGTAAIQIGLAHGMRVVATAGTERGRAHVEALGAHRVLDHGDPQHLAQVMEATSGHGADVVVELRADLNLGSVFACLAMGGRVVVVGSRGPVQINPRAAMTREATVCGMVLWNAGPEKLACIYTALAAGLAVGALRPVVGRSLALAEAAAAHVAVLEPGALGKIVLAI